MQYVSRTDQLKPSFTIYSILEMPVGNLADEVFDTPPLPRPITARRWRSETDVHTGLRISSAIRDTNQFVGGQTIVVRDELRQRTFVLSIETDGLYLTRVDQDFSSSRKLVYAGDVRRAHVCLRKYDGIPIVCYVVSDVNGYRLFVNKSEISTVSRNIDFPFMAIRQVPIGFAATEEPREALLTYKCRNENKIYLRRINPMDLSVDIERDLELPPVLGGAAVAIDDRNTMLKVEILSDSSVKPATLTSSDMFSSHSQLKEIDLSDVPHEVVVPGVSRLFLDHTNHRHVSLMVKKGGKTIVLDVHPDDDRIVAAIETDNALFSASDAFPKMPASTDNFRFGYGNGDTDGAGIITTILSNGKLLASNSQSGGYTYPEAVILNHDMQDMYCYGQTECYTSGAMANVVSMDYIFIETDEAGRSISGDLWLETWDMPLPEPVVKSEWVGDRLRIVIERDAWFFPGQTTFWIEPALTEITKVEFLGFREVVLDFSDAYRVKGQRVWFDTKNVFYFHRGVVQA